MVCPPDMLKRPSCPSYLSERLEIAECRFHVAPLSRVVSPPLYLCSFALTLQPSCVIRNSMKVIRKCSGSKARSITEPSKTSG